MSKPIVGERLVGFQPFEGVLPTDVRGFTSYPSPNKEDYVADLARRVAEMEWQINHVVRDDEIISSILLSREVAIISSDRVAIIGDVSFRDWHRDITGMAIGGLDPGVTRIRGDVIQTGKILNWDGDAYINLDAGKPEQDTEFISVQDKVKIYYDGGFAFGDPEGTCFSLDIETGLLLLNIQGDSDDEGLVVGDPGEGTGYVMNTKGLFGFSGGDLVLIHALQNYSWGDIDMTAGDFAVGNPAGDQYIHFDFDADPSGKMYFRGEINADDLVAGTITGRTLRTAASGLRFVVSATDGYAHWYDDEGDERICIGTGITQTTFLECGTLGTNTGKRGIVGLSKDQPGVMGSSDDSYGMDATSVEAYGLKASSGNSSGVGAESTSSLYGFETPDGLSVTDGANILIGSEGNPFTIHVFDGGWSSFSAYIT